MTIGGDTFIHDILQKYGYQNVFADRERYPSINLSEIRSSGCEVVLLSSEPYPFKEKHVAEITNALPGTEVILVNGEAFSWYGSRLAKNRPI